MERPEIIARFVTSPQGEPQFLEGVDKKHYEVVFEIENVPQEVYGAVFYLDPTYYDPIRSVQPDADGKIVLKTTSYGDYPIRVELQTEHGEVEVSGILSKALQRGQPAIEDPAIVSALKDIENN